jgi:uncharacterized protein YbbC (DUF1343 family)
LAARFKELALPGLACRPVSFQPTFNKWAGELCQGLELFPLDKSFRPLLTGLSLLQIILELYPDSLKLKEPPYEYEYERRPLDLILGRTDLYDRLAAGTTAAELAREWAGDLAAFQSERLDILIYD